MKHLLFAFLIFSLANQSLEYHSDKPQVIKGNNGKSYEVTVSASRRMYEKHVPSNEQVFIIQHFNQPAATPYHTQRPHIYAQRAFNNHQHQQQRHFKPNSNQHNGIFAAQNNYNQFSAHPDYQQQVATAHQQPLGQVALITPGAHEQQRTGVNPQSRAFPQATQYKYYLQQPLLNNFLPYSNHVLSPKYVSQSEAGQLDVYPYKQINDNPRPFTRTVSRCDVSGRCEPLNPAQNNNNSKNKIELKGRRMIPYSEVVMPQYPHN